MCFQYSKLFNTCKLASYERYLARFPSLARYLAAPGAIRDVWALLLICGLTGCSPDLLEFPSVFRNSKHNNGKPLGIPTFMALYGLHEHQNCWNPQVFCVSGPSQHALVDGRVLTDEQKHWKIHQFGMPQPRRIKVQTR